MVVEMVSVAAAEMQLTSMTSGGDVAVAEAPPYQKRGMQGSTELGGADCSCTILGIFSEA